MGERQRHRERNHFDWDSNCVHCSDLVGSILGHHALVCQAERIMTQQIIKTYERYFLGEDFSSPTYLHGNGNHQPRLIRKQRREPRARERIIADDEDAEKHDTGNYTIFPFLLGQHIVRSSLTGWSVRDIFAIERLLSQIVFGSLSRRVTVASPA